MYKPIVVVFLDCFLSLTGKLQRVLVGLSHFGRSPMQRSGNPLWFVFVQEIRNENLLLGKHQVLTFFVCLIIFMMVVSPVNSGKSRSMLSQGQLFSADLFCVK